MTVKEVVDARKTRIEADEAWGMLKTAKSLAVAKGKKVLRFDTVADEKNAVLKQAVGPSGNLRAPTYRVKDEFVVGFHPELYEEWMK